MKSEAVYSAAARGTEPKLVVHSLAYFSAFRLAVTASVGRSRNPTSRLSRSLSGRWPLRPLRSLKYKFPFNGCKHFGLPWRSPEQYANHYPNWSPKCASILVVNSRFDCAPILVFTVPQFLFYCAPILGFAVPQCSVFTVPQFSFLSCPNFRRGVPQSCPNFCCCNSLRKTDIHGQYKNWGTAAKNLGQELGHNKKLHLGHSKNRELGHSKNPELGHSITRVGAQ